MKEIMERINKAIRQIRMMIQKSALIAFLLIIFNSLLLAQAPSVACAHPGFNPQPWLEDFAQLMSEMSGHYANLEYAIQERRMDLPALRRDTETKLSQSCDESDARKALEAFFKAFGDGHLVLDWPKPATTEAKPDEPQSLCVRLGYKTFGIKPGIEFSSFAQFNSIGGPEADRFPGGILRLSDTARLGVLRMPIFSEHAYPDACEQTIQEMHLQNSDKCDEKCEDRIEIATANRLTAAMLRRVDQLKAAGATAILVDITRNGGGSDWVEPLPRVLSRIPLREAPSGFIKHKHWTKQLQEKLEDVETDLKNGSQPKDVVEETAARLRSAITRSEEHCDRSPVWTDGKLSCSLLVNDVFFGGSNLLPYAAPGSFSALQSKTDLFYPLDYNYTESQDRLPLYVVVDAGTGSAAEYFPSVLQDNGAATIFGEVTGGAGCGYTDGGIPAVLKNSKATVKMPDCVRYRKNGMNEVAGVTPDVLVPWSTHDSPYIKAQKLLRSLTSAIETQPH
jgi:hypothetical protein